MVLPLKVASIWSVTTAPLDVVIWHDQVARSPLSEPAQLPVMESMDSVIVSPSDVMLMVSPPVLPTGSAAHELDVTVSWMEYSPSTAEPELPAPVPEPQAVRNNIVMSVRFIVVLD